MSLPLTNKNTRYECCDCGWIGLEEDRNKVPGTPIAGIKTLEYVCPTCRCREFFNVDYSERFLADHIKVILSWPLTDFRQGLKLLIMDELRGIQHSTDERQSQKARHAIVCKEISDREGGEL